MIDDPMMAARLLESLGDALPVCARLTERVRRMLLDCTDMPDLSPDCIVVALNYAGDKGGVKCLLKERGPTDRHVIQVSITQLRFDPRHPLARQIAAYQRHRRKRIKQVGPAHGLTSTPSLRRDEGLDQAWVQR